MIGSHVNQLHSKGLGGLKISILGKDSCIGNCKPKDSDLFSPGEMADLFEARKLPDPKKTYDTTFPDIYLKPMTAAEINRYVYMLEIKERDKCRSLDHIERNNCAITAFQMSEVERANLMYVNNFMSYDAMKKIYEKAYGIMSILPIKLSAKERWKGAGNLIVGAVVGFIAGGPIGFFTGSAAAVTKQIADDRAKYAAKGAATFEKAVQDITALSTLKQNQDAELKKQQLWASLKQSLPFIIGTVAVGGALIYFGEDLKKLMNKNF